MRDPTRRNRNIGTAKHGHGSDNKFIIPQPLAIMKSFYERLKNYDKIVKTINNHIFWFVVEKAHRNSPHACTVNDIENIIKHIPVSDYGDLKLIILRQPKRKEMILSPVWGRLIYSYEFEDDFYPAIILESVDYRKQLKRDKKLSLDSQKEFERLKEDGVKFSEKKNCYIADIYPDLVRNIQLYRTLLHEFGHYVQYWDFVEKPGRDDEEFEEWELRNNNYFKLPDVEKEIFAHIYADNLREELIEKKIIPFEKLI